MPARLPLLFVLLAGCAAPAVDAPPAPAPHAAPDPAEAKAYYALPKEAVCRLGDLDARHAQALTVQFSADGKTFFTGGWPGLRVWDASTFKLLRQYEREELRGWPIVATPDGRYFIATQDKQLHVVNRADGKLAHTIKTGHRRECFALSPDGKAVATGSWEGEVLLWDVETGKRRDFLAAHPPVQDKPQPGIVPQEPRVPPIVFVAFAPDGRTVASAAAGDVVRGWDAKTGKPVWAFDRATTCEGPFAFSPDGQLIALPTYRPVGPEQAAGIGLWRLSDGTRPVELETGGFGGGSFGAYCLAFSPDGKCLAAGGGDHKLRVWDTKTGKLHFAAPTGSSIQEVQFSRDSKTLACISMGLTLWEVATGKELLDGPGHAGSVQVIAVSSDGKTAFTGGGEGSVRAWDAANGKQLWMSPLQAGGDWPYAMALAPGGKELAVAGRFGSIRLLDPRTGRELRKVPGAPQSIFALTYAPDGKTLAVLGGNLTIVLWDTETGKVKSEFVGYDGYGGGGGAALRFSPNGKTIIADVRRGPGGGGAIDFDGKPVKTKFDPNAGPGSDEDEKSRLVLWDVATGKRLRVLGEGTAHGHNDAVFSADGATLYARDYNDIAVIDVATGKEQRRFAVEWGTLVLGTDGKLWSGAVCYDPATGKKASEVAGGKNCIAAQSSDGRVLVTSGGGGNTALVWKLPGK